MMAFRYNLFFLTLVILGISAACTSTEKVTRTDEEPRRETTEEITESTNEELLALLAHTRSKLSDIYLTQQHDIPEAFLKKDTTDNSYYNPFDGYRIQILSSRNVNLADSVSTQFRIWADTTFTGYVPKTYVFFKQPYFKVHVGDFQDRQKANTLSRMIKEKYPDAWVVHDRINPNFTPADTTKFDMTETKRNNRRDSNNPTDN